VCDTLRIRAKPWKTDLKSADAKAAWGFKSPPRAPEFPGFGRKWAAWKAGAKAPVCAARFSGLKPAANPAGAKAPFWEFGVQGPKGPC